MFETRNLSLTKHEKTAKSAMIAINAILGICFSRKRAWISREKLARVARQNTSHVHYIKPYLFTK